MNLQRSTGRFIQRAAALILSIGVAAAGLTPERARADSPGVQTRVVVWGDTYWGLPPVDLTNAVQISAGEYIGMAATADKRVVMWGNNTHGQMDVPPDLTNIVAVAAGHAHCLALRDDGTVVAWGSGKTSLGYFSWPENGQAIVPAGLTDVKAIVASHRNSLALRSNGTVVCWGNNEFYGQNNVPASANGSTAIACYQDVCLALKTNGTVVKWGAAYAGLGSVPAGLNGVAGIANGAFRSIVARTNGAGVAWGTSYLGEGAIPPGFNGTKSIACGNYHNLALKTNGTVFAWGGNSEGETNVPPGLTNVIQVTARGFQSMALIDESIPILPIFATQPQSRTNNAGSSATFSVSISAASTPSFTYQWLKDGVPLSNGPNAVGATDATLNLPQVTAANMADYAVIVSNAGGGVTSSVAHLTVLSGPPVILQQPTNTSALIGSVVKLTVVAGGTEPFNYQWFKNGAPIPSPNGDTLWFNSVSEQDNGVYSVGVGNAYGAIDSSNVVLVVESCAPKPSGLVAWWRAEGNHQDSIGGATGSTIGLSYPAGKVGQAFGYDGSTSSLIVPASTNLAVKNFTVEGWVFPTDSNTPRPIIEWAGSSGLASVQIWVNKGSGNSTSPGALYLGARSPTDTSLREQVVGYLPVNQWTHFAISISTSENGTGFSTHINGVWQGGITYIVPFTPNTSLPVNIGVRQNGSGEGLGGRRFAGRIDELAIYNRNLSDAEVSAIYSAAEAGKCFAGNQPFFTIQPTNQITQVAGGATFAAAAAGALPLSYQWQVNGSDIPGATNLTLLLANAQLFQSSNSYSVVASNAFGTTTSARAILTVVPPPLVIVQQPASLTLTQGAAATFSVVAEGIQPMTYQWEKSGRPLTNGPNVSGAQSASLTLTGISPADAGVYSVRISNSAAVQRSHLARLTVNIPYGHVVAWGDNQYGQTNVPIGLNDIRAVAGEPRETLALPTAPSDDGATA